MTEKQNGSQRLYSIDALRGLVILLMALDHSRDFFGDVRIRPEAIDSTYFGLFFTRWVTHFCAPTFVFLAGVSAFLHGQKLDSKRKLSWFLITRGVWLIFLEFTVIRFGLMFTVTQGPLIFIVIAAIGTSMILLGLFCWLPRPAILLLGIAIVCGHNLLDSINADQMGDFGWVWVFLHQPGYIPWANMVVGYPVLPWFGLMALGYGLAPYLAGDPVQRRRSAAGLGLAMIAMFLLLRAINQYGDPNPWAVQKIYPVKPVVESVDAEENPAMEINTSNSSVRTDRWRTMYSFLNTTKYPPSLLFVLMTLGPSLLVLSLLDWMGERNWLIRTLLVFGRVPLFFYILHFYLLHLVAWLLYWIFKGVIISPMHIDILPELPPEYGFNQPGWLIQVYIGWIVILLILYPLCKIYGDYKRKGKSSLWSYF